jgi:hypothetical protein
MQQAIAALGPHLSTFRFAAFGVGGAFAVVGFLHQTVGFGHDRVSFSLNRETIQDFLQYQFLAFLRSGNHRCPSPRVQGKDAVASQNSPSPEGLQEASTRAGMVGLMRGSAPRVAGKRMRRSARFRVLEHPLQARRRHNSLAPVLRGEGRGEGQNGKCQSYFSATRNLPDRRGGPSPAGIAPAAIGPRIDGASGNRILGDRLETGYPSSHWGRRLTLRPETFRGAVAAWSPIPRV